MNVWDYFQLNGKLAMVTGAGRGIGREIALTLAQAGAEVVLLSRTQAELDQLRDEIVAAGGSASCRVCDVTDRAAMRALIADLDRLDILVNNSGTNIPEPFVDVSDQNLDRVLELNVASCFVASQAAVKKMLERADRKSVPGVIVNITSQMGHVGSPDRSAYCMTKHAVEGLTKALAVELADQGIRVVSVAPTFVDTPLIRSIVDTPEKRQFLFSKIPLGRLGTVEEVAATVLFACSPAAGLVTGSALMADGGWTAQ